MVIIKECASPSAEADRGEQNKSIMQIAEGSRRSGLLKFYYSYDEFDLLHYTTWPQVPTSGHHTNEQRRASVSQNESV